MTPEAIWQRVDDGLPKLWVIRQALALRRRRPQLFGPQGSYQALFARGAKANHVVAFARGESVVTVVPRLMLRLSGTWGDTTLKLPTGGWRSELTGESLSGGEVRLTELLKRFPVALLSREEESA
jgi:(1->4)-alpha-D-glucan 1-alpha-D-glucosylmutase